MNAFQFVCKMLMVLHGKSANRCYINIDLTLLYYDQRIDRFVLLLNSPVCLWLQFYNNISFSCGVSFLLYYRFARSSFHIIFFAYEMKTLN